MFLQKTLNKSIGLRLLTDDAQKALSDFAKEHLKIINGARALIPKDPRRTAETH